jgi:MoxR-like ATPase
MRNVSSAQSLQVHSALLNLKKVPELVGTDSRKRAADCAYILTDTNIPLYMVGDSGTGKTVTGQWLCKRWAEQYDVPAYYHKLSQEDTKTATMLGLRMVNGSLQVVDGLLARAARENAIVFLDEITHSTTNMILMLNAFDGAESVITIGDEIIDASGMKIMYGSNKSSHAGNIRVPQSFLNRALTIEFDYPGRDDEIAIAKAICLKDSRVGGLRATPDAAIKYVTALIRELRPINKAFPFSVRNIAKICLYLDSIAYRSKVTGIDKTFQGGANSEATKRRMTLRIAGTQAQSTDQIVAGEIRQFIEYASKVGVDKFREIVLAGLGLNADAEGLEFDDEPLRTKAFGMIL